MIPPLIVETALELGINLIAITDHNSSANIEAVQKAALSTPLIVLPGMELQTREDVHTLCLFDSLEQIADFQNIVSDSLPGIKNNEEYFGGQYVVDATGEFVRHEERLLITSSTLSLNEAYALVSNLGGVFIPAHINRKAFGLIESLGFVPPDIPFDALEISRHITPAQALATIPSISSTPLIQNGDVHRLSEFLGATHLFLDSPTINEIRLALRSQSGRKAEIFQP